MKHRPHLKFQLDIEYDQWLVGEFLTFKENDIFSKSILNHYPQLAVCKELGTEKRREFTNSFIKDYYDTHKQDLKNTAEQASKDWLKIESSFFDITDQIFSLHATKYDWPEGNYICYLSIFNCNPRFIKEKEFMAYYKHTSSINCVCVHEMLHFIFYDYVQTHYPLKYEKLGKKGLWKLSEIFNDVVMGLPEFIAITKQAIPDIYNAETDEELSRYQLLWKKSRNIKVFLERYFSE